MRELRASDELVLRTRDGLGWTRVLLTSRRPCSEPSPSSSARSLRWSTVGAEGRIRPGTSGMLFGGYADLGGGVCATWLPDAVLRALSGQQAPLFVGLAEVSAETLGALLGAPPETPDPFETSLAAGSAAVGVEGEDGEVTWSLTLLATVPVPPPPSEAAERDNTLRVWIEGPTAAFGDDDSPTLELRAGRARQTLVAGYGEGNGERYRWLFLGDGRSLGTLTRADRVELRVGRSLRVQLDDNPIGVLSAARDALERSYAALGGELDGDAPSP